MNLVNRLPLLIIASCLFWVATALVLLANAQLQENSIPSLVNQSSSWAVIGGTSIFWLWANSKRYNTSLSDNYKFFCLILPVIAVPLYIFKNRGPKGFFVWLANFSIALIVFLVTLTIIERSFGVFGIIQNA